MPNCRARYDGRHAEGFAAGASAASATVYTDDATACEGLPRQRASVKHAAGEYVRGKAHTNGIESFWAMLKRAYVGTFHKISPKHLDRYVQEFVGRHNVRDLDPIEQMQAMRLGMEGKRLIAASGLAGGAPAWRAARYWPAPPAIDCRLCPSKASIFELLVVAVLHGQAIRGGAVVRGLAG